VWVQFCEDPLVVPVIDALGSARNVMWGADYPHSEGTFPRSREITSRVLDHCDDADRAAVLSINAAVLYGIDAAALTA
jgi:predicted TIM-barrel fold metal-dependent hydrolase